MDPLAGRFQERRRLILAGVAVNVALAAAKILGGWLGHSQALVADGIESSLDIVSSLLLWGAFKYSERPPDEDHPYGHGKMESFAAVLAALLVVAAGFLVALHSAKEILGAQASPAILPAPYTLVILVATILIKEFLFRWMSRKGETLGSRALQVDALHHRSDAMTSLAAGIGITAALLGGPSWAAADSVAALFSCLIIVFNGWRMFRGSIGEILDEQISSEIVAKILAEAQAVPGVSSVEKCRVRKSGLMHLADLHVRVAGDRTVREGHDIAHRVKDRLMAAHDFRLADITVHIEPED